MERLEGTLHIEQGAVADVELTAGKSKHRARARAACSLRLPDGALIPVEAGQAGLRGWKPQIVTSGRWDDVSPEWAALFSDVAPGPHVRVTLRRTGPLQGDRLVVVGRIMREAPSEARYRSQPLPGRPVRVEAEQLLSPEAASEPATGSPPATEGNALHPNPRDPWSTGWLVVASVAAALAVLPMVQLIALPAAWSLRWSAAATVLASLLFAATAATNVLDLPGFVHGDELRDQRTTLLVAWAAVGFLPLVLYTLTYTESIPLLLSGDAGANSYTKTGAVAGLRVNMLRGYVAVLCGAVAALAATQWAVTRKAARWARFLIGPLSGPADLVQGRWVVVEGIVRTDGALARECRHARLGRHLGTSTKSEGRSFALETGRGEVRVGQGGVWASTEKSDRESTTYYRIRSGVPAVVAGRMEVGEDGPAVPGRGEESLFVYATGSGSARQDLAKRVWARRALVAIAAAAALTGLALAGLPYWAGGASTTSDSRSVPAD